MSVLKAELSRALEPRCFEGPYMLEELGFVNRIAKKYPTLMTEVLFDEVGMTLDTENVHGTQGPYAGHWYTAHPDPEDTTRWNARIPFVFRGNQLEASVPATAIHDRKVRFFSCEGIDKSILRSGAVAFTLSFSAAFWKLYSNRILNPVNAV